MNAKELALAALNATSGLADIYTGLLAMGVSFEDIAAVMTSKSFNEIAKLMESDIFSGRKNSFMASTALDAVLKGKIPGLKKGEVIGLLRSAKGKKVVEARTEQQGKSEAKKAAMWLLDNICEKDERLLQSNITLDTIVDKILDAGIINDLLGVANKSMSLYDDGDFDDIPDFDDDPDFGDFEEGGSTVKVVDVMAKDFRWDNLKRGLSLIEAVKVAKAHIGNDTAGLKKIASIMPIVEAQKILGSAAGINKGVKTKDYDRYTWRLNIERYYNQYRPQDEKRFSLARYIREEAYRKAVDEAYNKDKEGILYNPLEVLMNVPHYKEMLKAWALGDQAIKRRSFYSNLLDTIADIITYDKGHVKRITPEGFKALQRAISEEMILNWLDVADIRQDISYKGEDSYPTQRYVGNELKAVNGPWVIRLNTTNGRASFKHFVETAVVDLLKKNYPDNDFVKALTPSTKNSITGVQTFLKFDIPMNHLDNADPSIIARYGKILEGFKAIMGDTLYGKKVGDLFFLYNLIVNKDGSGPDVMTPIFEAIVNLPSAESVSANSNINCYENFLLSEYYKYINELDDAQEGGMRVYCSDRFINDCKRLINEADDPTLIDKKTPRNPDNTFRVAAPEDLGTTSSTNQDMMEAVHGISFREVIDALKTYNNEVDGHVFVINDMMFNGDFDGINDGGNLKNYYTSLGEDAYTKGYVMTQPAFIHNGNIYLNINHLTMKSLTHEWMHLMLAGMK